jgi:hypothetical protein
MAVELGCSTDSYCLATIVPAEGKADRSVTYHPPSRIPSYDKAGARLGCGEDHDNVS